MKSCSCGAGLFCLENTLSRREDGFPLSRERRRECGKFSWQWQWVRCSVGPCPLPGRGYLLGEDGFPLSRERRTGSAANSHGSGSGYVVAWGLVHCRVGATCSEKMDSRFRGKDGGNAANSHGSGSGNVVAWGLVHCRVGATCSEKMDSRFRGKDGREVRPNLMAMAAGTA